MSWEGVAAIAAPAITGIAGWWFTRRKAAAEAKALELSNTETQVEMWKDLVKELRQDLASRSGELTEVKNQLAELVKLSNEQTKHIQHLEKVVEAQNRKIAELKRSIK